MFPDDLAHNDPRVFLYHFPPFPDRPWQDLSKEEVEKVICIFARESLFPYPPVVEKRKEKQARPDSPHLFPDFASDRPLNQFVYRGQLPWQWERFMEQPALTESDTFGGFPDSHAFAKDNRQVWAGGYCHEKFSFVVNWAEGNGKIKKAFAEWLATKGRRPHTEFRRGNVTSLDDAMRQLGALRLCEAGVTAKQACLVYKAFKPSKNPEDAESQFYRWARKAKPTIRKTFPNPDI